MQAKPVISTETSSSAISGDDTLRSRRSSAEASLLSPRQHRHRQRTLNRPTWSLLSGLLAFLALLAILQHGPGARGLGDLEADQLMGHLLWWPLALSVFFGLSALAVLVAFRMRNPDGKEDSELRHIVGRKLVKFNLIGMFFFFGWLGGLFLVTVGLMIRG